VKSALLLDVIIRKSSPVLELLTRKDKSLLIRWDTLLILDLGLDILDSIAGLYLERDRFSGQGLDENLHTASQSEHQMQSRLFLDVVVGKSATVLELFSSKDESLLIWREAFLVLDFSLDVFDRVGRFNFKRNGLTS